MSNPNSKDTSTADTLAAFGEEKQKRADDLVPHFKKKKEESTDTGSKRYFRHRLKGQQPKGAQTFMNAATHKFTQNFLNNFTMSSQSAAAGSSGTLSSASTLMGQSQMHGGVIKEYNLTNSTLESPLTTDSNSPKETTHDIADMMVRSSNAHSIDASHTEGSSSALSSSLHSGNATKVLARHTESRRSDTSSVSRLSSTLTGQSQISDADMKIIVAESLQEGFGKQTQKIIVKQIMLYRNASKGKEEEEKKKVEGLVDSLASDLESYSKCELNDVQSVERNVVRTIENLKGLIGEHFDDVCWMLPSMLKTIYTNSKNEETISTSPRNS